MAICSVCGKGITKETVYRCYDCGKTYRKGCAEKKKSRWVKTYAATSRLV